MLDLAVWLSFGSCLTALLVACFAISKANNRYRQHINALHTAIQKKKDEDHQKYLAEIERRKEEERLQAELEERGF